MTERKNIIIVIAAIAVFASTFFMMGAEKEGKEQAELRSLLPQIAKWSQTEDAQNYYPENLFVYINGAAEIYLAYDFQELIVSQHKQDQSEMNVAVEIYNMGSEKNAFGIYSAERFSDNTFVDMGFHCNVVSIPKCSAINFSYSF